MSSSHSTFLRVHKCRLRFLIFLLSFMLLGLIWRLVSLTVINREFLLHQSRVSVVRSLSTLAHRGMILDRRGQPLAVSIPRVSVWINPAVFNPDPTDFNKLSRMLALPSKAIQDRVKQGVSRTFVYLKRDIDTKLGEKIQALKIPGLFLEKGYHRHYPTGPVAAHVVGLTNIDDKGQEGLELAYNTWLEGVPGLKKVIKDRLGRIVAEVGLVRDPRPGRNLELSLDSRIQYLAYQELVNSIKCHQAVSGSVVVLDLKTGEILAMTNWPSYNPNDRNTLRGGRTRNRAVTDLFEPGSLIKSFSMVSVLASGLVKPSNLVDTSPGWIMLDRGQIKDRRNYGIISLTKIMEVSSNVGISKLVLSLPPQNLWDILRGVGFGESTHSGFPGEQTGVLPYFKTCSQFVLATLSFGYSLSVTALQLAQSYSILANGGRRIPLTFLKISGEPAKGWQVIDKQASLEVLHMLESVLKQTGTAPLARVPGYRVAGKTGTAWIVGKQGYDKSRFNSFFIGIAPMNNPRLVVVVVLNDPKGKQYHGGQAAGPVFSRIMGRSLRLLNIPPDDL